MFRDAGAAVGKLSRRHGGPFVGYAPPNESSNDPKLNFEAL